MLRIWDSARGKDTGGSLWFEGVVTRWSEEEIKAREVGELRFIGGDPGSRWEALSGGKYKVKDAVDDFVGKRGFHWQVGWRIVTIRDRETS